MTWPVSRLGDVVESAQSGFACGEKSVVDGFKHLRMNNIHSDGRLDLSLVRTVPHDLASPKYRLRPEDVLVCTTNSGKLVGKSAVFKAAGDFAFSNHLTRLRVRRDVAEPAFVQKQLWFKWLHGEIEPLCKHWVNQSTLPKEALLDLEISLPDVEDQQRITKKLDHIAAHLEDTRARLETIPTILKRFRMSVLAAACSGKLTDAWRGNQDRSELAEDCVAPSAWAASTLGNLLEPSRGICYGVIKLGADCGDGIPCLRTSDVKPLEIELSGVKKISREIADQYKRTYLKGGEVLVNVRGTLGGVAVVPETLAGWNVSREVAVVPVDEQRILPEFACYWIAGPYAQSWLTDVAKGVAYTGINLSDLRLLPTAIPERDEQLEIVRRVRALLAQADDIEVRYRKARAFTERLMPSVLAKAFKGELCS